MEGKINVKYLETDDSFIAELGDLHIKLRKWYI